MKLGDEHAGLDCFSESDFVGEQETTSVATEHGDGGLELMRQDVDVGALRCLQKAGDAATRDERPRRPSPSCRADTPELAGRLAHDLDGVEGRQKLASGDCIASGGYFSECQETARAVRADAEYAPRPTAGANHVANVKKLHARSPT